jgi:hypothetical protein
MKSRWLDKAFVVSLVIGGLQRVRLRALCCNVAAAFWLGGCAALTPDEPAERAESPREGRQPAAAEEAVRSGRAGAGESAAPARSEAFDRLDKNGDGYLTLPEAAAEARLRREFQAADRDGDFRLDPAEFARVR